MPFQHLKGLDARRETRPRPPDPRPASETASPAEPCPLRSLADSIVPVPLPKPPRIDPAVVSARLTPPQITKLERLARLLEPDHRHNLSGAIAFLIDQLEIPK